MPQLAWSRPACVDLDRHYQVVRAQSTDDAYRLIQTILEAIQSLAHSPQKGTPVRRLFDEPNESDNLREVRLRYNEAGYLIHYIDLKDVVLILRIYYGI